MKGINIYISVALALLLGLVACMREETTDSLLPEDLVGTPIVFTATGLSNPTVTTFAAGTRATVDGNWEGVENVAIMIDGSVKVYSVEATDDNYTYATLSSTDPHYWSADEVTVTAWWPYTDGDTGLPDVVVQAEQNYQTNFEASDFISAEQTVTYDNTALEFTHRTARVTVTLKSGYNVSLDDYTSVTVSLTNLSDANNNPEEIVMYEYDGDNYTYVALVAPQAVTEGTITCVLDNRSFVYTMSSDTEWAAGKEYTYSISLADY